MIPDEGQLTSETAGNHLVTKNIYITKDNFVAVNILHTS